MLLTPDRRFRLLHSSVFKDYIYRYILYDAKQWTPQKIVVTTLKRLRLKIKDNETERYTRKVNLRSVGSRIQAEYSFRTSCKVKEEYHLSEDSKGVLEKGVFKLLAGDPFPVDTFVVWLATGQHCGYALVCLADENCLVADNVLQIIAKYTQDNILRDSPLAEILLKPEKMAAIVHQFLPNGQLLFMNHKLVKQYEKQLDTTLTGKH